MTQIRLWRLFQTFSNERAHFYTSSLAQVFVHRPINAQRDVLFDSRKPPPDRYSPHGPEDSGYVLNKMHDCFVYGSRVIHI